jgi:uncharacterized membrane protein/DNA-directed RNA polymerase subunit RPC12/RpoP
MPIESMRCPNCGAVVEVAPRAPLATCSYCGAKLTMPQPAESRPADPPAPQTLAQIAYQNELARIDREWEMERRNYVMRNEQGGGQPPTMAAGLFGGVLLVGFGIFWTASAASMGAPVFFPLFGVLFIAVGAVAGIGTVVKAQQYQQAYQAYQERRASIRPETFQPRDEPST